MKTLYPTLDFQNRTLKLSCPLSSESLRTTKQQKIITHPKVISYIHAPEFSENEVTVTVQYDRGA